MNLSLSNTLGRRMALASLDPDAKGYIDAVVAAGATVSGGQKSAINTFVKTGKADGWYSSLKRLYLPIWAAAAPNAICMTSLTSGTFNGTVTHADGYIQGNGITGYFDTGVTTGTLGITTSSAYMCALAKTELNSSGTAIGSRNSSIQIMQTSRQNTNVFGSIMTNNTGSGLLLSVATYLGIMSSGRSDGIRYNAKRTTASRSVLNTVTDANFGNVPTPNIAIMANNIVGTGAASFASNEFGAFVIGLGVNAAQDESFTLALKNLWETCTGLTLP